MSKWSTNPKPDDHRFIAVSRTTAIEWIEYLIQNVYAEAGGVAYHQIKGLPMGENYAILAANLTCFCYETHLLQKMVTKIKKETKRVRQFPKSDPSDHSEKPRSRKYETSSSRYVSLADISTTVLSSYTGPLISCRSYTTTVNAHQTTYETSPVEP